MANTPDDTAEDGGKPGVAEALQKIRKQPGRDKSEGTRREPEFCGDIGMKIARDGTWFYRGSPIGRMPLVKLFATVLRHEDDGFYLVTPVEKVSIEVEDSPFVAVAMTAAGDGEGQELRFRSNLDEEVVAGAKHPLRFRSEKDGSFTPFVTVKPGLDARLARPVYYDLVELAAEHQGRLGVWSGGEFFAFPDAG
jgi:hypothetical protein